MTIVSFIFVVIGLIPSITVVSGRVDLRAFGNNDDSVPYAFGCRRRHCGGGVFRPTTTQHRRWSSVRDLDRSVDGIVSDGGTKPFGGENDYDNDEDRAVSGGRFPASESGERRRIMSFPYCSVLRVDECWSLLRRLEKLRLQRLQGRVSKRNLVHIAGMGGTVVRLLGRHRRSAESKDSGSEKTTKTPEVAVRSPSGYSAFDATLLDQYREWRKQNGYGRHNARWGRRSLLRGEHEDGGALKDSGDISSDKDSLTTPTNSSANYIDVHHRTTRSAVVVEIEPQEELPDNERDMLDTYLAWRETHGYGTLAGRWG